ncbi:MAG: hypothetical protein RI894_2596 [Bacteroidota bacterium]
MKTMALCLAFIGVSGVFTQISTRFLSSKGRGFSIVIQPVYGKHPLEMAHYYELSATDSISFSELRFYISNITFFYKKKKVSSEPKSAHLIDVNEPASTEIHLKNKRTIEFDSLSFCLGIDSLTNVSNELSGDLDPLKGMYWTWQSGYINAKLEGNSNRCPTRKNAFQFHLGGYLSPYSNVQQLGFALPKGSNKAVFQLDIENFIKKIDLKTQHSIMSPSREAVYFSRNLKNQFAIINDYK